MNIQKKLSLNKHPGDCVPYSLVAAKNVKVSNDDRMIVNEEGLEDCKVIANAIHEDGINNFKIVGVIPTSTELILFIVNTDSNSSYIYRYNEQVDNCYRVNSNWKYNGGKIKGTYTYNVKNHLIVAIAESNASIDVPLKTINIDLDSDRPDSEMSVIPQITLPTISNLNYVSGGAYKGFYFIFIRYKIDKTNYTKWYSIGFPIFNDVIIPQVINKVCFRKTNVYEPKDEPNGYCYGNTDSFSDSKDICNQTFEISISGGRSGLYQLGFIVCKKDSTQAFRTDDLNNNIFKFSRDVLVEYNVADLTTDYYNYYNVGNIINYKNRIYIANYNEKTDNDDRTLSNGKTLEEAVKDITIKLRNKAINAYYNDYTTVNAVSEKGPYFKMANLQITGTADYQIKDISEVFNNNQYPFRTFRTLFNDTVIQGIAAHEYLKINYNAKIKVGSRGSHNLKEYLACHCFIIPTSYKYENNQTVYTLPSTVKIACYVYNGTGFTEDAVFTSGQVLFGDTIFDIDNCKMRITHSIIEPSYDFNERKKNDTLIPGEVYNFFIHFVDKYGDASRGYKLSNKDKYINNIVNDGSHCTIITFNWNNQGNGNIPYWAVISGDIPISNMFTQGVDPKLDFSNLPKLREIYERCTNMKIDPRQPYIGELVFTAFSGSHQDAINKGMKYMKESGTDYWEIPYLPIDPADVGREYEPIIRINSQSGKGGAAFVMNNNFGYDLPKRMHPEFSKLVQAKCEELGRELIPKELFEVFEKNYLEHKQKYVLSSRKIYEESENGNDYVHFKGKMKINGNEEVSLSGVGNGPIDAFFNAIKKVGLDKYEFISYSQHAISQGSDSKAVSYIDLKKPDGKNIFGIGIDSNVNVASVLGVLNAINRAEA